MTLRDLFVRIGGGMLSFGFASAAFAWDYEGHRIVNQLALASLPKEFPSFVREQGNAERIAFLAGEPDRWRNAGDLPIRHMNSLNHFCDLEYLTDAGLDLEKVTPFRYEFVVQFAAGRAANQGKFTAIDPRRNADRTQEWPGFVPWMIAEQYGKLKSGFSYLKAFEESGGTAEEIANAKANIVHVMGELGHYVGDCSQPLHTTKHFNGWVGDNPHGYTQWTGFHSWIDGGFLAKAGITLESVKSRTAPAKIISGAPQPDGRDPVFVAVMNYILEQHKFVEPLYALDKNGAFRAEVAEAAEGEGRAFIEERLLAGGRMLGALWLTAWRNAGPDTYLLGQLAKRKIAEQSAEAAK